MSRHLGPPPTTPLPPVPSGSRSACMRLNAACMDHKHRSCRERGGRQRVLACASACIVPNPPPPKPVTPKPSLTRRALRTAPMAGAWYTVPSRM